MIEGAARTPEEQKADPKISNAPVRQPSSRAPIVAVLALAIADLALLGWTAYLVATHPHALGWKEIAVCVGSALLAALCGCAAALIVSGRE